MSEQPPSPSDTAPLPWMGSPANLGAKQAWSSSGDRLILRYPFVRRDVYRQTFPLIGA